MRRRRPTSISRPRRLWWSFLWILEVLGEVQDAIGEERDLHLGRAGVGVRRAVLGDDLCFGRERHGVLPSGWRSRRPGRAVRITPEPHLLMQPERTRQCYGHRAPPHNRPKHGAAATALPSAAVSNGHPHGIRGAGRVEAVRRHRGARPGRSRRRARRGRHPARAERMRQDHAAAPHRRPRATRRRQRSTIDGTEPGTTRGAQAVRVRAAVAGAAAVAHGRGQRTPAAATSTHRANPSARCPIRRAARPGRPGRFRRRVPARAVGRDAAARSAWSARSRSGAPYLLMDEPFAALDEITRADMRHLLGRPVRAASTGGAVRHPLDRRGRVPVRSRGRAVGPPRSGRRRRSTSTCPGRGCPRSRTIRRSSPHETQAAPAAAHGGGPMSERAAEQHGRSGRRSERSRWLACWEAFVRRPRRAPRSCCSRRPRSSRTFVDTPGFYLDNIWVTGWHLAVGLAHLARDRRRRSARCSPRSAARAGQPTAARPDPRDAVGRLHQLDRAVGRPRHAGDRVPRRRSSPSPPSSTRPSAGCAAPTPPRGNCSRRSTLRAGRCCGGCACPSALPSLFTAARFNLGLGLAAAYFAEGASFNDVGTGSARPANVRPRSTRADRCGPRSCAPRRSASPARPWSCSCSNGGCCTGTCRSAPVTRGRPRRSAGELVPRTMRRTACRAHRPLATVRPSCAGSHPIIPRPSGGHP